jgi:DUF4097 and DUF4098 domain-containing protein YvlB
MGTGRIGRVVAATAIGITGLSLLSACGWAKESFSDSENVTDSFTSVRFANDSGEVTIRTGDEASVKREVRYGGDKPGRTVRVENGVLELDACDKPDCSIDYEVTVPEGTKVTGEADSGSIDISGVAEAIVKASSGEVKVEDVPGDVTVEASSGSVDLAGIGGEVVAKADSGNVRVELSEPRDVRVDADSGNVEVTVPGGSYRVSTSTDSGNVDSDVDDDSSGDHHLDLHTDSGNISVSQA